MKKIKDLFRAAEARAVALAVGGASLVGAPMAFASGGITFDTASILAAIAVMLAAGIAIYTAYAAGKWTLRAFGLIGGK